MKGNTLTLKKLQEFYKEVKNTSPNEYFTLELWQLDWRFPFIQKKIYFVLGKSEMKKIKKPKC